jgi:hypothetical protein
MNTLRNRIVEHLTYVKLENKMEHEEVDTDTPNNQRKPRLEKNNNSEF